MTPRDVLDAIIAALDPDDVPPDFIVMVKVTDHQGLETVVKGAELERMMRNPELYQVAEARVILDVRRIRKTILDEINYILDEVKKSVVQKNLAF